MRVAAFLLFMCLSEYLLD